MVQSDQLKYWLTNLLIKIKFLVYSLSLCLFLSLSVCLSVRPSVCLSECLSVRSSVRPSVCPSVYRSIYLSLLMSQYWRFKKCEKKEREQMNHFFYNFNLSRSFKTHSWLYKGGGVRVFDFNRIGVIRIESTQNFISRL